ncbi:hypothetical protein O5O45_07110 [Hahella aquimaris]|uniref:hypothetical protein n=1 Tax=Hahella sp. HNIBRBA332 TaxID=3015983 RepID=UPI00273ABA07|nr:hypothetical protein [Hahella sp. HNIBRBA332]WLQ15682.1 hypothetical protein O5O45_07110 [Hahella sp. HNIBRBA332]
MEWDKSGGHISVYGKAPLDAESPPAVGDTVMLTEGGRKHWITVTVTERKEEMIAGEIKDISSCEDEDDSFEMSVGESVLFHCDSVKIIVRHK